MSTALTVRCSGSLLAQYATVRFGQWDEIFPDPALAIALLDRLLHHATTLNIRGESYRLRHRRHAGLAVPAQL